VTVDHLDRPSPDVARDLLDEAIGAGRMSTVIGRCEDEYEGRASSYLGPGVRLLVLKPDGSLLVHTGEGRTPVNWQPPGCVHEACVEGNGLRVRSSRETPAEVIDVRFDEVVSATAFDLEDPAELQLSGTESDLRERILATPEDVEQGFEPVESEYRTGVGAVDILGRDDDGRTVAIELKRRRVGPEAAGQLARYVEAIREDDPDARGILIAPSITDTARELLDERGLEFVSLAPE
jgi:RecB family endonuclease NucS